MAFFRGREFLPVQGNELLCHRQPCRRFCEHVAGTFFCNARDRDRTSLSVGCSDHRSNRLPMRNLSPLSSAGWRAARSRSGRRSPAQWRAAPAAVQARALGRGTLPQPRSPAARVSRTGRRSPVASPAPAARGAPDGGYGEQFRATGSRRGARGGARASAPPAPSPARLPLPC
jgi:hypothetical protein